MSDERTVETHAKTGTKQHESKSVEVTEELVKSQVTSCHTIYDQLSSADNDLTNESIGMVEEGS
tara:strand:- start:907 stop:1098 length:192 start_codon:yes stop_codon:yes gene_type:complete